jgi:hypothetical protein
MEDITTTHEDVIAPGAMASGATYSNRINPCGIVPAAAGTIAGETTNTCIQEDSDRTTQGLFTGSPRRRTIKARKSGNGSHKKPDSREGAGKPAGIHAPRGTHEAAEILAGEGYVVGTITHPGAVFDLAGISPAGAILVRVVRPKVPVGNAREVRELYETDIREIQPYCLSAADNIQFWVFSREAGLLRYRVFDWGIGNVSTMQKILGKKGVTGSNQKSAPPGTANQRARNSPCPAGKTG